MRHHRPGDAAWYSHVEMAITPWNCNLVPLSPEFALPGSRVIEVVEIADVGHQAAVHVHLYIRRFT
jgi:hypothetical protein